MYAGKALVAQVLDFLAWTIFHGIDIWATIGFAHCLAPSIRVMPFAQLTYREILRDLIGL